MGIGRAARNRHRRRRDAGTRRELLTSAQVRARPRRGRAGDGRRPLLRRGLPLALRLRRGRRLHRGGELPEARRAARPRAQRGAPRVDPHGGQGRARQPAGGPARGDDVGHAVVRRHGPQRPGGRRRRGRAARARAAAPGGHRLRDEPGAGREPLPRGGHGGRRRGHELPRGRRRGGPRPGRRARRDGGGLVPQGRRGGRRAGAVELRARAHAGQGRAPGREGRRRLVRARGRPGRPRRAELARALLPGRALRRAHRRRRGGAVVHARGGLGRRRRAGRARRHVQGGAGRREGRREGPRLLHDRRGRGLAGRAGRAPQPRPDGLGAGRPLPQSD